MYENRQVNVSRLAHDIQINHITSLRDPAQRKKLTAIGWAETVINDCGQSAMALRDVRAKQKLRQERGPSPAPDRPRMLRPRHPVTNAFA